jgi:hypothetical protein
VAGPRCVSQPVDLGLRDRTVELSTAGCTRAQARAVKLGRRMQNKKPQNISRSFIARVTVP